MKHSLNLATARHENNRPFLVAATFVGTLGLLAFLVLSHAAYASWKSSRELRAEIGGWQDQIRTSRQRQEALGKYFRTPSAQQVLERSAFLNSLIDERSFPWSKVFVDLEHTLPPGVRVVDISPRLENGRAEVALTVGAETDASKIQFLEAIEKSNVFSGMVVKEEKRADQPGQADKILLNLTVWYSTT